MKWRVNMLEIVDANLVANGSTRSNQNGASVTANSSSTMSKPKTVASTEPNQTSNALFRGQVVFIVKQKQLKTINMSHTALKQLQMAGNFLLSLIEKI